MRQLFADTQRPSGGGELRIRDFGAFTWTPRGCQNWSPTRPSNPGPSTAPKKNKGFPGSKGLQSGTPGPGFEGLRGSEKANWNGQAMHGVARHPVLPCLQFGNEHFDNNIPVIVWRWGAAPMAPRARPSRIIIFAPCDCVNSCGTPALQNEGIGKNLPEGPPRNCPVPPRSPQLQMPTRTVSMRVLS